MKLLDTYALSAGAKIDKPFIFEQFFPLVFDKYITIQAQTKYDSKDYTYWQDVINILFPILDAKGIKIVQVGGPKEFLYQYVVDLRGRTDLNQLAYIIKNSMLHLGSDSLGIHLASSYDIPIVGLYSVSQSSVSGPHWGDKNKQILFDAYLRTSTGKPSYADKEYPKSVNLIRPEEISDAVFKLLGFNIQTPIKTVFTGSKYSPQIVREFIPTKSHPITNPEAPIEIRMDLHFNETILQEQLQYCRALVITNKRIDKNILKTFKDRIVGLVYLIEENDDPQFISDIQNIGLNIVLMSYLTEEQIQPKKINYYEHGKINVVEPEQKEKWEEIRSKIGNLYFKTNKILSDNGNVYAGIISRKQNEEIKDDFRYYKVIDVPEFWNELPFMTLVEINRS